MTYQVEKRADNRYYVNRLGSMDKLLFYHNLNSEWPEPSNPNNHKKMLDALYDLYQVEDSLHDGDIFETPHGDFICNGVHVVELTCAEGCSWSEGGEHDTSCPKYDEINGSKP